MRRLLAGWMVVMALVGSLAAGAAVQVMMRGVTVTDAGGAVRLLSGPAVLQVSYTASLMEQDVVIIEPGSF
ncbi:MAG: hypothetical protein BAA04_11690 [Firmicutes bacterium ZCTH02-B6]|nr:MAG: hypothetical protein BAA04_11690 [Firmicutes bacterium ZCTH02-B6]